MRNEERIKYLEMIEEIIKRMAENSVKMKEWFVTLSCAIVAGFFASQRAELLFIISGAALVFWIHDSSYLRNERRYRELYACNCDISQSIDKFDLRGKEYDKDGKKITTWKAMWSWSTWVLYLIFIVASITVGIILLYTNACADPAVVVGE